jgi:hypothetical protein
MRHGLRLSLEQLAQAAGASTACDGWKEAGRGPWRQCVPQLATFFLRTAVGHGFLNSAARVYGHIIDA